MNIVRLALERPVAVVSAVFLVLLFGWIALTTIPVQLAPDVRRPQISVTTTWGGAAPEEVEREIVSRQEEALKGLEGVLEISSVAETGRARVTLEFRVGTDMDRALLLVSNRLQQISGYPDEVDEPRLEIAGNEDNAIAWFAITRLPGNERPIHEYGTFVEDVVKARLERVPGVSEVNFFGGAERELQVIVEPERLALYRLTVPDVLQALRTADVSVSAGDVDEGKRRYVVRVEGELSSPEAVSSVLIRSLQDPATGRVARIRVGDVAEVRWGYSEPVARIRRLGEPALALNATREPGANVMDIMRDIRAEIEALANGPMRAQGLTIRQVYDETVYIESAIDLVVQNIWIGGALAAAVLLLFLRSIGATLVIALSIPVSVVATFVAMAATGRTLNVMSLAGIAFAVGMVVDAAIVVLENIFRLRQKGLRPFDAAYRGTLQVWGAIVVSALTTVLVFVPILLMQSEVGQLFRDIAVAISASVLLSLVVAGTVVPALARRFLRFDVSRLAEERRIPVVDSLASLFARMVLGFMRRIVTHRGLSLLLVLAVTAAAGTFAWRFLPKLEYLPEGNRNLVFGVIQPPPGYNLETTLRIAERIESEVRPLWASVSGPESAPGEPPRIRDFFFVALRGAAFVGASAVDEQRAGELIEPLRRPIFAEPGTFGFMSQPSIFGRGIGGGRVVRLDISGPDLETLLEVALAAAGRVQQVLPREQGNQLRPRPGLELGAPEVRLVPDRVRLADAGVSAETFALTVDALNDGVRVSEIAEGGNRFDLVLMGPRDAAARTQDVGQIPVVLPDGTILPARELARLLVTAGPTEIRHEERQRTVTLEIRPAPAVPLETAMDLVRDNVIAPLQQAGLPDGVTMRLAGTADRLTETFRELSLDLLLAVLIVYLVMAVLLESFVYPLVIMVSVPLAAAGGVLGLVVLNLFAFQALDMLTLLGFVILIGIVVNNAILLVDRAVSYWREEAHDAAGAILAAVSDRLRPIFMTTMTSVFGMLPLVIAPGAGSELYRGLGSVVVGGLSLSAVLTLFLVPPLLAIVLVTRERWVERREAARAREAAAGGAVGDATPAE